MRLVRSWPTTLRFPIAIATSAALLWIAGLAAAVSFDEFLGFTMDWESIVPVFAVLALMLVVFPGLPAWWMMHRWARNRHTLSLAIGVVYTLGFIVLIALIEAGDARRGLHVDIVRETVAFAPMAGFFLIGPALISWIVWPIVHPQPDAVGAPQVFD